MPGALPFWLESTPMANVLVLLAASMTPAPVRLATAKLTSDFALTSASVYSLPAAGSVKEPE